jgi:hypothetical protein
LYRRFAAAVRECFAAAEAQAEEEKAEPVAAHGRKPKRRISEAAPSGTRQGASRNFAGLYDRSAFDPLF